MAGRRKLAIGPAWLAAVAIGSLLLASLALAPGGAEAKERCGTYKSTSKFDRARVIAIRGVSCERARRIAKRFDRKGEETGRWDCALAHDSRRRLFSCGKGGSGGDLRDRPHALEARGVR